MRCALLLSLLLIFLATVMTAVSIGIPYWQYARSPTLKYQGLWQSCNDRRKECVLILVPPEFLDAVRVMMLFGLCFYAICTILVFVYMFVKKEKNSLINASIVLMLIGGVCCMIAVIVYGAKYTFLLESQGTSLHAGFGLAVCVTIMGFCCSVLLCMAKIRGEVD